MDDNYLTADEIAAQLRISGKTVRAWCRSGKLRAIKAGKQWRIRPSDLALFLETNSQEVQSETKS